MKKVTKIEGVQNNSTQKKKLRVAAYCRVSTGSDAQLESLEAQKTHYERYINSREDWQFAGLYFDEGITGTKAEKRPELLRLIVNQRKLTLLSPNPSAAFLETRPTAWHL